MDPNRAIRHEQDKSVIYALLTRIDEAAKRRYVDTTHSIHNEETDGSYGLRPVVLGNPTVMVATCRVRLAEVSYDWFALSVQTGGDNGLSFEIVRDPDTGESVRRDIIIHALTYEPGQDNVHDTTDIENPALRTACLSYANTVLDGLATLPTTE